MTVADDDAQASAAAQLPSAARFGPEHCTPESDWLEVGNEFATVRVRRVLTHNGARLQVHSSKLETDVFLDSVVLESLTWQTPESLSLFLKTPLEPFRPAAADSSLDT